MDAVGKIIGKSQRITFADRKGKSQAKTSRTFLADSGLIESAEKCGSIKRMFSGVADRKSFGTIADFDPGA